ncbi:MAG: hypothetical protein OQJ89_00740 [Kangiellaceae bacterium]|nr:hypothetical protein [Kangiellaceae bacterium]MCW9015467.1 hypothetical protein [Kangiellaceae bacterium]
MWNTFFKALVLISIIFNSILIKVEASEQSSDLVAEVKQNSVYMFSDIQGRHEALKEILINYKIVDDELNWLSPNADLVLMGNLTGDASSAYETMKLVRTIQQSAVQSGAQLRVVLGEKDVEFVLSEFDGYSADSEVEVEVEAEVEAEREAFQLLDWLSKQDFIAQLNGHLFINGGISSRTKKRDIADINQTLKRSLEEYKSSWQMLLEKDEALIGKKFGERYSAVKLLPESDEKKSFLKTQKSYLFSKFWPVNYTGNSFCHPLFERQNLDEILQRWQVKKIWSARVDSEAVGFSERFQGTMTFIDDNDSSKNNSEILGAIIGESETYKLLHGKNEFSGMPKLLASRKYQLPYDMTADEIKAFLKTAKVVSKQQTKEGKTKPLKIYLEKDGKRVKAIFKYVNMSGRGARKGVPRTGDKYDYESAAFYLDRMLDIGLVPITVERVVSNKRGVVQLWIDGLVSAVPLNTREESYTGMCDAQQQENMINTFDYLIMNLDRNQTNITFTKKDWQIWFIDHTRSFGNETKAPRFLRGVKIEPTNLFKEKLSKITKEQLDELKGWLSQKQLDSMWERRNRIVESDYILD